MWVTEPGFVVRFFVFFPVYLAEVGRSDGFTLIVLTVCVLCLFLMVLWVGLQFVIVAFPGHTHFFSRACV